MHECMGCMGGWRDGRVARLSCPQQSHGEGGGGGGELLKGTATVTYTALGWSLSAIGATSWATAYAAAVPAA